MTELADEKAQRGHLLHVTTGGGHTIQEPEWKFSIECVDPTSCGGWQECDGDHDGYDPEEETSPAYDEEEDVLIHGVLHEWRYGWTIPYEGCPVADALNWSTIDSAWDLAQQHGAGVHVVDDDWDDTYCTLMWVRTLPSGGGDRG